MLEKKAEYNMEYLVYGLFFGENTLYIFMPETFVPNMKTEIRKLPKTTAIAILRTYSKLIRCAKFSILTSISLYYYLTLLFGSNMSLIVSPITLNAKTDTKIKNPGVRSHGL